MKCVLFYHAFISCWNNGNAHFLRGYARELAALGHEVVVFEPTDGWSRLNAIREIGGEAIQDVGRLFPGISVRRYDAALDFDEALDGADLVIVHEWNSPDVIEQVGRRRAHGAPYTLLFHDTHHRVITAPDELAQFDLDAFDGVLAFGEVLRQIYMKLGWANRAYTWHEAADVALYHPLSDVERAEDLVWIGNWGDGERSAELNEFLVEPVAELNLHASVYGVRYSDGALHTIRTAGIRYGGWLPAHRAPVAFAGARATIHVPRGPYVRLLPGIPTIRVFEALACGIPLVSAPWSDAEELFPDGAYLTAAHGADMSRKLRAVLDDRELSSALVATGLRAVLERHTCRHRAQQLVGIVEAIRASGTSSQPLRYIGASA
ncbi:glycosyltransferase [Bradyrhizobium sacchari]|uniref:Spore maturation protein CgeB n=1 Tax=Bradyrhizobium sacchari TaxID=1399419 RepID=A0A560JRW1_9BRAD|nr:glycosyltransferase [Bradyrhizobium sacchari]OPY98846.1 glycosyltransferase [Bradyrhizobium sacchari]TWB60319.1 spore maturation protein CgeB [Bradyrhizobium sacchari]TWB73871.1 spore maturation protein CgeB [Bradyrhizobium sacchari]